MALIPEEVAEKEFALVLRGYDKAEVRSYLQAVAAGLREAIHAASAAEASADTAAAAAMAAKDATDAMIAEKANSAPAEASVAAVQAMRTTTGAAPVNPAADGEASDWSNLGEEIAAVLRTAHEQANGLRSEAEAQAATIRNRAQQNADEARQASEKDRSEAAVALEHAQREALDLVAAAQARIDDRLAKAKEKARREAEASVAELTEQVRELTSTRDKVRVELTALRSRLDDSLAVTSGDTVSTY